MWLNEVGVYATTDKMVKMLVANKIDKVLHLCLCVHAVTCLIKFTPTRIHLLHVDASTHSHTYSLHGRSLIAK